MIRMLDWSDIEIGSYCQFKNELAIKIAKDELFLCSSKKIEYVFNSNMYLVFETEFEKHADCNVAIRLNYIWTE